MIIVLFIISFLLDGILLSISTISSVVSPLFSLLALVIAYPYSTDNPKKIYIGAIIMGILYDITYTNSLFLNTLLFVGFLYFIDKLFKVFTNNFLNTFIVSTIVILLYQFLIWLFYFSLGVIDLEMGKLIDIVANSLIINYVYILVFYFIMYAISKKLKLKKLL